MPSRRNNIEMTAAERRAFIESRKTLTIVSNGVGGFPHPMPMWFHQDDAGAIHCTTFRKSQKVLNYQRDAKATLLVESGVEYAELKGVVIYSHCEIIDQLDAVVDTLVRINSRGRTLDEDQRKALTAAVSQTASKRVLLKFAPERYVSWDHSKLGGRY
ncbi:MAG: pyridoxamine 5'-phosphate oxidase [Gammaproteobacteria bacterium]|nr:pyridoxamine 5'-phosphate oxidase [Gammaproteobacteria bacterium]